MVGIEQKWAPSLGGLRKQKEWGGTRDYGVAAVLGLGSEVDPNIEANFTKLRELMESATGGEDSLWVLAVLLGGEYFSGDVAASVNPLSLFDTEFAHSLKRVPSMICLSVRTDSPETGQVVGLEAGKYGSDGANAQAWTDSKIYVRATETGTYSFVVI